MERTIEIDKRYAVGPLADIGDHGPVTTMADYDDEGDVRINLLVCLDCGWISDDNRTFHHTDCDRDEHRINQTWRERLDEDGFPGWED